MGDDKREKHNRKIDGSQPDTERTRAAPTRLSISEDDTVLSASPESATVVSANPGPVAPSATTYVLAKHHDETLVAGSSPNPETLYSDAPITKIERMERTLRPQHGGVQREIDVGSVIRGRFILNQVLGRGGMGAVYRALDLIKEEAGDDNPYVAIKLLSGSFKDHPQAFVTLQREAKKTQELAHPNIVTVYDFDREDDVVYLTMEELSGAALIDVIRGKTDQVLDYKQKLDIIQQIAKGLAYAHSKGIVHSDLKPANLFLTDDGTVKVLDFGIARAVSTELYQDSFDAGELGALTLTYASPEMIRFEPPHPSDDIYALGIIICELFDGIHPFDRKDAKTAFEEHLQPRIPKLKNPFLKKCIRQTLALERNDRIADANVFLKKFANATAAPKRIVSAVGIALIAIAANFFYIQTIDVEAVPFDSLTEVQQAKFFDYIKQGNTALRFQDLQEAVVNFNAAYEIHTSHDDVLQSKQKIIQIFKDNLAKAKDPASKEFFESQFNDLRLYPVFSDIESL